MSIIAKVAILIMFVLTLNCYGGLAMESSNKKIKVYGADWCPDAQRARSVLDELKVDYEWIDIESSKGAAETVRNLNNGEIILPTIIFPDGSKLVEPSNSELKYKVRG